MSYYLDINVNTTFSPFKERISTDLMSISLMSDSMVKYTAINKKFNVNRAWKNDTVRELFLVPLYNDLLKNYWSDKKFGSITHFSKRNLKKLVRKFGKSTSTISQEITEMIERDRKKNPTMDRKVYAYNCQGTFSHFMFLAPRLFKASDGVNINELMTDEMKNHNGFPFLKSFHGIEVCKNIMLTKRFINNFEENKVKETHSE